GLELEAEAFGQLRGRLPVALDEALLAEFDQVVEGLASFRDRERREQDPPELELDGAALRDLERPGHGVLEPWEVLRHLLWRLEEELVRVEAPVLGVLERVARLDAEQRLVRVRILRVEVVHVAGRDERQPGFLGERDQLRVHTLLLGDTGVLDLDIGRVAPEDLREAVEIGARILSSTLDQRP